MYERLKADFEGGRIFNLDPLIPKELKISWEFDCVMRGDAEPRPRRRYALPHQHSAVI